MQLSAYAPDRSKARTNIYSNAFPGLHPVAVPAFICFHSPSNLAQSYRRTRLIMANSVCVYLTSSSIIFSEIHCY